MFSIFLLHTSPITTGEESLPTNDLHSYTKNWEVKDTGLTLPRGTGREGRGEDVNVIVSCSRPSLLGPVRK